jgi:hypothetical protein
MAGGQDPSLDAERLSAERWFRESTAAASSPGELRLVMNLESLVKSDYFRSYWIQRNASSIRQYWAGIADVTRSAAAITEHRVLLRVPPSNDAAQPPTAPSSVSTLVALVPPDAGVYRVSSRPNPNQFATLLTAKLLAAASSQPLDYRFAPAAVALDARTGSEADLETRIDALLPAEDAHSSAAAAVRTLLENNPPEAILGVQSTVPAGGTFLETPAVFVLAASADWNNSAIETAFTTAVNSLFTNSTLGAEWAAATAGRYPVRRLNGLAPLFYTARGKLLFLANDAAQLAAVLDRTGTAPPAANAPFFYPRGATEPAFSWAIWSA